jgi:threonylcarbamoyladenosine tRNA methylthiotransferase MtaB
MPLRVAFATLGCKLNQLESESLAAAFAAAGAELVAAEPADASESFDLLVLNSCTVTSKAEQKARRLVRQALAANPRAAAIVTGCYAQVEAGAIAALGDRVFVVGGDAKDSLLGLPGYLAEVWGGRGDLADALRDWSAGAGSGVGGDRFAFEPATFAFHSRPSLKVQDGCDNRCSYCRVCIARGPSVSLAPELALERARALEARGAAEIVLTGVNLSQYRWGELGFPGLLEALIAGTERVAFRLSSYEPDRIDEAFVAAFAKARVRPHVHLAVQSGADPVLAAMGRRYRRGRVLEAVRALRGARRDPFIGADLIVGFPGETDEDARATLELAEECDFAWIHAFRFSPRPGTKAANLPGRVPERVAGERARELAVLARRGKAAYAARWSGAELEAVFEGSDEATSENYLKLLLRGVAEGARAGQALVCLFESRCAAAQPYDGVAKYLHNI